MLVAVMGHAHPNFLGWQATDARRTVPT
jgi:hypothetical protein